MSHTTINPEKPPKSIDFIASSSWKSANETIAAFAYEPLFMESLQNSGIDPLDRTSSEYANALSFYALDYCHTHADILAPDEAAQITLIANAPYLSHVQRDLDHFEHERKHRRLDNDEWSYLNDTLKPYAVWYNQRLSDYIYTHPNSNLSEINQTLSDSTISHFPHKEHEVTEKLHAITKGARKEAITRQLLDRTPIEYVPATPEEDLHGGDLIILYNGKRIKVDVKSSLDAIARIRGGYDEIESKGLMYAITRDKRDTYGSIVLFPGFTEAELGNNCRLPADGLDERAMMLAIQLQRACVELGV